MSLPVRTPSGAAASDTQSGSWPRLLLSSEALLRQSGGNQRFAFMHDCLDPYDLASVECEEHEVTAIAFDPAYAPLAVLDDAGQHDVAYAAKMLGPEGESLPLLKQATHVAADSLWAVEYAELRKVGPNDEHDVLVEI